MSAALGIPARRQTPGFDAEYESRVLRRHKISLGHFGDILSSQSLGVVLKKLNLT